MNDSGIFDDGQLSRESSVVRSEDSKPETIPPFPGQKRRTTGRANIKKRRRYEQVHIEHNYVLTSLPPLYPDQQFEYLCGDQAEESNDDMRLKNSSTTKASANPLLGEDTRAQNDELVGIDNEATEHDLSTAAKSNDPNSESQLEEQLVKGDGRLGRADSSPKIETDDTLTDSQMMTHHEESFGENDEAREDDSETDSSHGQESPANEEDEDLNENVDEENREEDEYDEDDDEGGEDNYGDEKDEYVEDSEDTFLRLPGADRNVVNVMMAEIPQGFVKLKMGTEKLNDKIQEVSKMIKEEWASSQQRKRKVVKPKKLNLNKAIVKKKKGRYSMEDICVAATILYCSKRVYNYLKNNKLMNLPCIRLVYKRLEKFTCPPGKSPQVMRLLQLKLKTLDEAERFVSISFDEIYLEQKFSYCPRLRQGFKALKVILKMKRFY